MVTIRRRAQRGASTLGCLITLLLFVAAVYYGVNIGEPWVRYYRLTDAMKSSARLAPTLTDAVIRRRLVEKAQELQLPAEAHKFTITRGGKPRRISITGEYSESVRLPFFDHTFVFRPHAEEPL